MSNPSLYLAALDVIRAHYLAGIAALEAGDHAAAGEMFAHPVGEILVHLETLFTERGAPDLMAPMLRATELALDPADTGAAIAAAREVMALLDETETTAPVTDQDSLTVATGVLLDMVDRAAQQYRVAFASEMPGEAWLDGYGLYKVAALRAATLLPELRTADPAQAAALDHAVARLAAAFPSIEQPATPPVPVGEVLAAASAAAFAAAP